MTHVKSRRTKRHPLSSSALSVREREILELLTKGLTNKEIGDRLDRSAFTVKNHLARIYAKLRVHSRTAAVTAYLRS